MADSDADYSSGEERRQAKRGKKRPSKPSDGHARKKVTTAYHMFLRERLPKLKVEKPNLDPKEYLTTVCTVWRSLDEEERKVYAERAKEANLNRKDDEPEEHVEKKERRVKVHKDDKNDKVKGSATAYHMFLKDRLHQIKTDNPDMPPKEILPTAGAIWKGLTAGEREVYNEKAREENNRKALAVEVVEGRMGKERHVPIFSQAFIALNREREKEFRRLQKQISEVQQQSALLSAHSDNLKTAIEKLESEVNSQRTRNSESVENKAKIKSIVGYVLLELSSHSDGSTETLENLIALSSDDLLSKLENFSEDQIAKLDPEQKTKIKKSLTGILEYVDTST